MEAQADFQLNEDLLKNQIKPLQSIQQAHVNSIESLAPHPSGHQFATGSHDHTIKLWDMGKLTSSVTLHDHKEGVWSLDYSSDGKLLISSSPDKSVLIWDSDKSSAGRKLIAHQDKVYCAKFNPTDRYVASIGEGAELMIWDMVKTDKPLKSIDLKALVGYDITWSSKDDCLFVSTMGLRTVALDAKNFEVVNEDVALQGHEDKKMYGITTNWATLPGDIFAASEVGHVVWYKWKNSKLQKEIEFKAHYGGCRNVRLHPHNQHLISSGRDGSVRLWNCLQEEPPRIQSNLVLHDEMVTSPIFVGDEYVVTGSWDQSVGVWKYNDLL